MDSYTSRGSTEDVPLDVPGEAVPTRIRERYAIDVDSTMRSLSAMDEAKIARQGGGEKIRFLSQAQLAVGLNTLKILPPWTSEPPHAGRFWRAVWVHFGLGAPGETRTALCSRRMNRLGLPRQKGEDSFGACAVCDALEALWAVPFEQRSPEEKKFLSDYKARLSYLFNVVWLKGGGKSHVDEGSYLLSCSPRLGEAILTSFKFVLTMKPAEVPDNFDVQIKKVPADGKFFGGKQVYEFQEVYPVVPMTELDLADPKFERYSLDLLYRPKDAGAVAGLFRQTACGRHLLGEAPARAESESRGAPSPAAAEEPPFRHGPSERARPAAGASSSSGRGPAREPGADDLTPEEEEMLAALASRARGRFGPTEDEIRATERARAGRR